MKNNGVAAGAAPIDPVQSSPAASKTGRLPWRESVTRAHLSGGMTVYGIASDDNINVAWVTATVPEAPARRAFIVRACNSHRALVAASVAQAILIEGAQAILTSYLVPGGIDAATAIERLLAHLDGPNERRVKALHVAALANTSGPSDTRPEGTSNS